MFFVAFLGRWTRFSCIKSFGLNVAIFFISFWTAAVILVNNLETRTNCPITAQNFMKFGKLQLDCCTYLLGASGITAIYTVLGRLRDFQFILRFYMERPVYIKSSRLITYSRIVGNNNDHDDNNYSKDTFIQITIIKND